MFNSSISHSNSTIQTGLPMIQYSSTKMAPAISWVGKEAAGSLRVSSPVCPIELFWTSSLTGVEMNSIDLCCYWAQWEDLTKLLNYQPTTDIHYYSCNKLKHSRCGSHWAKVYTEAAWVLMLFVTITMESTLPPKFPKSLKLRHLLPYFSQNSATYKERITNIC